MVLWKRLALALCLFAVGVAAGWTLRSRPGGTEADREIRRGGAGLTNPLLDCEVVRYPRGMELHPFREDLEDLVADSLRRGEAAAVSVYFRDLNNGPWFGIAEREPFTPGSLLKVPLLMACLLEGEKDPSFLQRRIRFEGLPEREGIGRFEAEVPLVKGRTYTVTELIEQMAIFSDNYAALLLDREVDRRLLELVYGELGLDVDLVREPLKPALVSPKTYGQFFRVLYNTSFLNRVMSENALAYLTRSVYRDGLVRGVPPGTVVSHKFGINAVTVDGREQVQLHDCGIVYAPSRPYLLCVMTRGEEERRLAGVIAEVSRLVSDRVRQPRPAGIIDRYRELFEH